MLNFFLLSFYFFNGPNLQDLNNKNEAIVFVKQLIYNGDSY